MQGIEAKEAQMIRRYLLSILVGGATMMPAMYGQTPAEKQHEKRMQRQQTRIGNGVASGQLTPRETKNIEARQARINREIAGAAAANGGTLTPGQKAVVHKQEVRQGRRIARKKNNGLTR